MSQTWPLVGRDDELRFVVGALIDDGTRGVVLVGPPGVGKTRLAQEAATVARSRGYATVAAAATPALAEIPLGALAPWLPDGVVAEPDRTRSLARACAALADRGGGAPLVLCVDDAHLLDPLSVALIHHAVTTGTASLLATTRRGSGAAGELTALWTSGAVERLEVTGLSRAEHDELVESVLGGPVHGPALERLWRITDGNVLFLRVVVDTALAAGDLHDRAGMWRLDGRLRPGPALVDLVELRLGTLTPSEGRVVDYVAFAEPVDAELMLTLASAAELEQAERTGTVVASLEDRRLRLRLAHPLYGEVVRARTPLLRAAAIVRDLANVLDARGAVRADDVLALATWRLTAGEPCELELLLDASRHARNRFDYELAERLAAAAVALHGGRTASLERAHCLFLAGRFREAEAVYAAIGTDAGSTSGVSDRERAEVAVARATNLMWGVGDFAAADGLLESTAWQVADPDVRDGLRAQHGRVALAAGALTRALELTHGVLDRPGADATTRLAAAVGRVPALAIAGRTSEALALSRSMPFRLELLGDYPLEVGTVAVSEASAHWFAGDLAPAAEVATALYDNAVEIGYWEAICDGARARASVELAIGRPRSAMRWAQEALTSIPDGDRPDLVCWCQAVLAEAMAVAGDPSVGHAVAAINASRHPSVRIFDGQIVRAKAWAAAMAGEVSSAVSMLEDGVAKARDAGAFAVECLLLHDIVRLDRPERAADRLVELTRLVDGRWPAAFAAHASSLVAHDADGLERVATAFSAIGAALLAAEAEMQAARAHHRLGAERRRRSATSRAATLAEQCEEARTPALSVPDTVVPLTRREREIAALAGQGLASPEIARRLTVSTRTVEGHLHRMYAKLGVNRREELAAHVST